MHVVFMPYGINHEVDFLEIQMSAQKHKLNMWKKGEKNKYIWITGRLIKGPFGVWEYCCPKEDADMVLTTLEFDNESYKQKLGKFKLAALRTALKCKKAPKFDKSISLIWIKEHVSIIPLGVRYDGEIVEDEGPYKGWTHEGI